jgi:hypothetical protein
MLTYSNSLMPSMLFTNYRYAKTVCNTNTYTVTGCGYSINKRTFAKTTWENISVELKYDEHTRLPILIGSGFGDTFQNSKYYFLLHGYYNSSKQFEIIKTNYFIRETKDKNIPPSMSIINSITYMVTGYNKTNKTLELVSDVSQAVLNIKIN